jgi:hypothetical protein
MVTSPGADRRIPVPAGLRKGNPAREPHRGSLGRREGRRSRATPRHRLARHQEGVADDETHAFFIRLMDEAGAMLGGRVTSDGTCAVLDSRRSGSSR